MRFGSTVPLASFVPPTSGAGQLSAGERYEQSVAQVPRALEALIAAGCEFAEFGVGMTAPELPESAFEGFRRAVEASGLRAECFNSYIPPRLKLVGPNRDWKAIQQYVAVSAERMASLGGEVVVFGSGGARSVPEGYPRQKAEAELIEFLQMAGEHAQQFGLQIAVEPLNRRESNILNTIAEALALVERVAHPHVGVLADFYHLDEEGEPFEHIAQAGERLFHVHVADTGRLYPGSGSYDYPSFYAALQGAGYDRRISIECNWHNFAEEVGPAMRFLRESYRAFLESQGS